MVNHATRQQFINGLADLIDADPVAGVAVTQELRDAALARIRKGKGQVGMVIQGMLNGKQGQVDPGMNALEMFGATSEVLRNYNNNQSITSAADFSCYQR